jgi:hypothetical protein
MIPPPATLEEFDPSAYHFYRAAFQILKDADVRFLLGGAYAFGYYTGITRHTKDLDVFVRAADVKSTLSVLGAAGYRTELLFPHWLAKAFHDYDFVDIIFSSGNGKCPVDDAWFDNAPVGKVLGVDVPLIPVEEMIWQKAYIMERERFDGADVNHLLRARGKHLDWDRLLGRFGSDWRVLLSHLVLFGFVYPGEQPTVPEKVLSELVARLSKKDEGDRALCRGTLLSRMQYITDVEDWNYRDARQKPVGPLSNEDVKRWTDAGR